MAKKEYQADSGKFMGDSHQVFEGTRGEKVHRGSHRRHSRKKSRRGGRKHRR